MFQAAVRSCIEASAIREADTAVLLAGPGSQDAHANSDISKLARLLYEQSAYSRVEAAFISQTAPTIPETIELLAREARQVIVLPCLQFEGRDYRLLEKQVQASQANGHEHEMEIRLLACLSQQPGFMDMLCARNEQALSDRSLLPVRWRQIQVQLAAEMEAEHKRQPGQPAGDEAALQKMLAKIDSTLPPASAGRRKSEQPAPEPELLLDSQERIQWVKMFAVLEPFSSSDVLALGGAAALRRSLLEPGLPADCLAAAEKYSAVLDEFGRGINMLTGLSIVESPVAGWIGIECGHQEMAVWLVRAIIVENIMVRREGSLLYLPAGPDFSREDEILSIVTVFVRAWRFWIKHIRGKQPEASDD